jgi:hypothetical protein
LLLLREVDEVRVGHDLLKLALVRVLLQVQLLRALREIQ